MRIIGGEHRGRKLKMPESREVRPTQDRIREALFNIIRVRIPEGRILDLYAGSGAFGIEALSRGAQLAVFVDNNSNCIGTIKANVSLLAEKANFAQVIKADAIRTISRLEKEDRKFDIVFLDPPYHKGLARNCLIKVDACDILSARGFAIAEHFKKNVMPERIGMLYRFREKKYGDTALSFYRRINE